MRSLILGVLVAVLLAGGLFLAFWFQSTPNGSPEPSGTSTTVETTTPSSSSTTSSQNGNGGKVESEDEEPESEAGDDDEDRSGDATGEQVETTDASSENESMASEEGGDAAEERLVFVLRLETESGAPLAGARVEGTARTRPLGSRRTGPGGTVEWAGLREEDGQIGFVVRHPFLEKLLKVGPFSLAEGEKTVTVPFTETELGRLACRVTGTPSGDLLKAFSVELAEGPRTGFTLPLELPSGGGTASVRLPAGTYRIRVQAPGHSSSPLQQVEIEAGGSASVEVSLPSLGTLSGHILNADGNPSRGAHDLELEQLTAPTGHTVRKRRMMRIQTGNAGEWELEGVDAGKLRLRAQKPGAAETSSEWAEVELEAGGETTVPDLRLRRLPPRIEGIVRGPGGEPIPNVTVRCGSQSTRTDDRGKYALYGLEAGRHQLQFFGPDEYGQTRKKIELGEGRLRVDAELERTGSVLGTVSRPDGSPAEGVKVVLVSEAENQRIQAGTDPKGRYFVAGLTPGEYRIELPDDTDVPATRAVVRPGERTRAPDIVTTSSD